nr:peptidase S8 [Acidobacteriota bacterium]
MGQKLIILRGTQSTTRDIFLGPMARPTGVDLTPPTVSVEVADLSKKELSAVARERDVVAIAPAIPMKLIEPVAMPGDAAPAAAGAA